MIITCPQCDAQYLLPDDAIGANGRRVKCTTCAHVWIQQAEIHAEIEEAVFQPDFVDPFEARRKRMGDETPAVRPVITADPVVTVDAPVSVLAMKTMALALGFVLLTLGCAVAIRHSVVSWWPPTALMFETLGAPTPAPGANLALKDVTVGTSAPLDKGGLLEVAGKLHNPTRSPEFLPMLRIRLNGENSEVLKDWDINLYGKTLPPGKEAGFTYSLKDAHPDGQSVTLFFVD